MNPRNPFAAIFEQVESTDRYWETFVKTRFADDLSKLLEQSDMTRTDLAKRIGHSSAYITKVLRGDSNFTIGTMTKLLRAFDMVPRIEPVARKSFYATIEAGNAPPSTLSRVSYRSTSMPFEHALTYVKFLPEEMLQNIDVVVQCGDLVLGEGVVQVKREKKEETSEPEFVGAAA